jgi:hypothetical protein
MKKPTLPTAVTHPQAATVLSTTTVAALLVYESNTRLGFDLNIIEASFIVGVFSTLYFMLLGPKKA